MSRTPGCRTMCKKNNNLALSLITRSTESFLYKQVVSFIWRCLRIRITTKGDVVAKAQDNGIFIFISMNMGSSTVSLAAHNVYDFDVSIVLEPSNRWTAGPMRYHRIGDYGRKVTAESLA